MVRTKQGGSILGFILIGVVLAALLVGGVYFVRQQTAKQVTQPTPVEPTSSQQPSSSDSSESPAPATEDKSDNTDTSDKKEETSANNTPTENSSQPSSQTATELPKTGPSQTIGVLIVVGILSYAVVLYARSRRLNLSF
jgi:cytoskeletal protein RodZ